MNHVLPVVSTLQIICIRVTLISNKTSAERVFPADHDLLYVIFLKMALEVFIKLLKKVHGFLLANLFWNCLHF